MLKSFVAAACALAFASTNARAQSPIGPTAAAPEISASARGDVRMPAQRAFINFSVESRDPSAAKSGTANSQRIATVIDALKNAGVPASDIVTSGYTVSPDYEYERNSSRPKLNGFVARNSIRVTVTKFENIGGLIDSGLAAGATQVSIAQLGPVDSSEPRRQALALAVAEARRDAEVMARAAGGSLGRLISISSTSTGAIPMMREMSMDQVVVTGVATSAATTTPITPTELTISAVAFARWEFIPGSR